MNQTEQSPSLPPFLDATATKRDGLAFIGLSLQQRHQNHWDFNMIQDRNYDHVATTSDDGWLVGGGESGEDSFKLPNADSAHIEIMRIGTFNPEFGGLPQEELTNAILSGDILIPSMEIVPTAIVKNENLPPELEVRFDMIQEDDTPVYQWKNWQIQFVKNQLFTKFSFPARFVPGPFHMTIVRKCTFRSALHELKYFESANSVVNNWSKIGPKPLMKLHIFKTRNEIVETFEPNFLGPYNTPEKVEIIKNILNVYRPLNM